MYQGKKQQFDWTFTLVVGDVVALALAMVSTYLVGKYAVQGARPSVFTATAYLVVVLFLMRHLNLYSWSHFTKARRALLPLLTSMVMGLVCFTALWFIFGHPLLEDYSRWLLIDTVLSFLIVAGERLIVRYLLMDVFRLVPVERIAFFGWSSRTERVLKAMARDMGSFQETIGYFRPNENPNEEPLPGYTVLAPLSEIEPKLVEQRISLLLVDESMLTLVQLKTLGEICARCFVNLKIIPTAFDILATKVSLRVIAGVPVMGVYSLRHDRFHNRIAKRAVDVCGALVGLILSGPVIIIMAILIKRESPGPVFFKQIRLGLHNEPFGILKLRSMRTDAEVSTGAVWAVKDDPRRLKIGTFMRAWNLDELPQFWNVLVGDMSLVGPRPERPEFVQGFKETIRYYNLRHSCKPGVTGWAAVNGLRGNTSLEDRLEYDLFYIENWSLSLDFKILAMTFAPPQNAY